MRERLEDFGRLSEILRQVLDSTIFDKYDVHEDRFIEMMADADNAEKLCYEIHELERSISVAYQIARWGDLED